MIDWDKTYNIRIEDDIAKALEYSAQHFNLTVSQPTLGSQTTLLPIKDCNSGELD